MKPVLHCIAAVVTASFCIAAPADDVAAAVRKLVEAPNYSWTQTPDPSARNRHPIEGVTERDGYTVITLTSDSGTRVIVRKGQSAVQQDPGGNWVTRDQTRPQGEMTPAGGIARLLAAIRNLRAVDGAFIGELSEEVLTAGLTFDGGPPKNVSGSIKVWLKDGVVAKCEIRRKGTVFTRGGQREFDSTITSEFRNIGTTKVVVPAAARQKLGT